MEPEVTRPGAKRPVAAKPGGKRKQVLNMEAGDRVSVLGHRGYVGGNGVEQWYGIGRLQYHFLVSQGLNPSHTFLDVACGSLRLGQYLIPFLEAGHYFGIEGEEKLVRAGLEHELLFGLASSKRPTFTFNYTFDVSFIERFDVAIAQSLFTHLTPDDIALCFRQLAPVAGQDAKFFFTYFDGPEQNNPATSHAQLGWRYPFARLAELATPSGWKVDRIGDWGHPRGQQMAVARRS